MESLPTGWVPLGRMSYAQRVRTASALPPSRKFWVLLVVLYLLSWGLVRWATERFGFVALLAAIAVVALVGVALVLIAARRNVAPEVNFDTGEIRVGGDVVPLSDIAAALVLRVRRRGRTSNYLHLSATGHRPALVCLHSTPAEQLAPVERELVAEAIRRSGVRVPEAPSDPYDPAGKFAWLDNPDHLDRDAAIEYVLHTPASGEPERAPARRKSIWLDDD